jgi:hypothetical protein
MSKTANIKICDELGSVSFESLSKTIGQMAISANLKLVVLGINIYLIYNIHSVSI